MTTGKIIHIHQIHCKYQLIKLYGHESYIRFISSCTILTMRNPLNKTIIYFFRVINFRLFQKFNC